MLTDGPSDRSSISGLGAVVVGILAAGRVISSSGIIVHETLMLADRESAKADEVSEAMKAKTANKFMKILTLCFI